MVKALRFRRLLALWAAVFLLSCACRLGAQQSSAIRGTVTDSTGGAIVNAEVTVVAVSQGLSLKTSTNSTGAYIVPNLEAGTYTIRVTAPGYKVFEATNVILRIAQNARVDAEMAIGAVTTQAVVNGTDMGTVETESSQISYTITGQQITQMVLNGRDFAQLVSLSPGVVNQTGSDEGVTGVQGSVGFSIEGGRPQYNNWELDGSTIMDNGNNTSLNVTPSLDAISETHVLTSNYGAQYGRNGSGTVQSQTKSGTEQLHGDALSSFAMTLSMRGTTSSRRFPSTRSTISDSRSVAQCGFPTSMLRRRKRPSSFIRRNGARQSFRATCTTIRIRRCRRGAETFPTCVRLPAAVLIQRTTPTARSIRQPAPTTPTMQ